MTDQAIDNDDAAFEAEIEEARAAQSEPEPQLEGEEAPEKVADPDREKLERVARDKDGMARQERQKRRAAEERAERLEARLAALERGGGQSDEDIDFSKVPSVVDDPIGNIEAMRKMAERLARQDQEQQAQTAQQRQFQQINTRMGEFESEYRAENPDYDEAVAFFRESREAELGDLGYAGTELKSVLANELVGLAVRAMQSGRDPAEIVHNLAKKRGFTAKGVEQAVDKSAGVVQSIDRGLKAAKSLSGVSSSQGGGEITVEQLNRLDGAAFDAAMDKFKAQNKRQRTAH